MDLELDKGRLGRVAEVVEMLGGPTQASAALNRSRGLVYKWISGESDVYARDIDILCRKAGVTPSWLMWGLQPKLISMTSGDPYPRSQDDWEMIRVYDIRVSAGPGATIREEARIDRVAFTSSWVRNRVGTVDEEDLAILYVDGDSQEPTLRHGDMVMINRVDQRLRDGFFVVRLGDELMVKRLQRMGPSILALKSENPAFDPVQINLEKDGDDFAVIGRVVWVGRSL